MANVNTTLLGGIGTHDFAALANQYLPYSNLMMDSVRKKTYFLDFCKKDDKCVNGQIINPILGSDVSNVRVGGYMNTSNLQDEEMLRGEITNFGMVSLRLLFSRKDLRVADKGDYKKSYLRIIPEMVNRGVENMKEKLSLGLITGGALDVSTAAGTNSGVIKVNDPTRFKRGEKYTFKDSNSFEENFVIATSLKDKTITVSASKGGTAKNVTALASGTVIYIPGVLTSSTDTTNKFPMGILPQVLPSGVTAGGATGSANLWGQPKSTYAVLQTPSVDWSTLFTGNTTFANLGRRAHRALTDVISLGIPTPKTFIAGPRTYSSIVTAFQESNLARGQNMSNWKKAKGYGYRAIDIGNVIGHDSTLMAVTEAPEGILLGLDGDSWTCYSQGGLQRVEGPGLDKGWWWLAGSEAADWMMGTDYDHVLQLALREPNKNCIIYNVPDLTASF